MKNLIHPLLFIITSICFSNVYAQQSDILESYVQAGIGSNLTLKQQDADLRKAQESIRQAKSLFLPRLTFEANYTVAAGGRKIDFPIGDLLNPVYSTLNQITQTSQFPTLENQQIQFLPNNFHETKVSFAFPLYNSDLRYNRDIQQQLFQSKAAQKAAYEHELRYQITETYLQFLQAAEGEKIWLNTKTVLQELRRFNESLVKNNVATRDVTATADYELSKADLEIIKLRKAQKDAKAYINFLINRDLNSEIKTDTLLLRATVPVYDPTALIAQSMEKRSEFAALRAGMQAAETDVRRNDANSKIPDFYIGGSLGFQGYGYKFNKEQAYALAQIGLTYDLFDGGQRKSKTQEARIESEKIHTQYQQVQQQVALQITIAWNDLESARNAHATTQVGLRAAEETFRIVQNKYRASQVLLIEFLEAQNRVTVARLQNVLAWSDVLLKDAALRQAAGL
ncbi:MAG TPA: TolC family protein [Saprospiraceae bacterium]|nr:TolC family protein [Saprospiraceae bacterium]